MDETAYAIGEALALLKEAAEPELSYGLHGTLYFSNSGFLLLSVPNALGRGAFDALHEPGAEIPVTDNGRYNAHITVMYPEEVEAAGGPGKITERGHAVSYTTGHVFTVESANPEYGRVWAMSVKSPELEKIRRSYGLSSWPKEDRPFHITFAIRKRNILREGPVSKVRSIRQILRYWDQDHGREVKQSADSAETLKAVEKARQATEEPKSPEQAAAGNYKKGKVVIHGLTIAIENPKGSTRKGADKNGKPWSVEMKNDYGYFLGTKGADSDLIDVFVGPNPDCELIYVVDQQDPVSGKFDEVKCLLGFHTKEEAKAAYLSNYTAGWKGLRDITGMTVAQFKDWLENGDTKKPVAGVTVKAATDTATKSGPSRLISVQDVEEHSKAVAAKTGYRITHSKIEGLGLHAYKPFQAGDVIISGFMQRLPGDIVHKYNLSDEARFTNHSTEPNAKIQKNGNQVDLIALKPIQPNTEITADYVVATKHLGPLFEYYYQYEPYKGGSSTGRASVGSGGV